MRATRRRGNQKIYKNFETEVIDDGEYHRETGRSSLVVRLDIDSYHDRNVKRKQHDKININRDRVFAVVFHSSLLASCGW